MKHLLTILTFLAFGQITAQTTINLCGSTTTTTSPTGTFYDSGGPSGNYSNNQSCSLLISPNCGTSITLNFTSFATESCCDRVRVYDGNQALSTNLLLDHRGTSIPSQVVATSGEMLVLWNSDGSVIGPGFEANWTSAISPAGNPPIANFSTNSSNPSYNQTIQFFDISTNSPSSWHWDFGDSTTSNLQNPTHIYGKSGTYTVTLTVTNCRGTDTYSSNIYINPPSYFNVSPRIINAATTNCNDSVTIPLKLYNNSGSTFNYNFTTTQGDALKDTSIQYYNTSGASTFHSFNFSPSSVNAQVELEILLSNITSGGSRYTDLYIESGFYQQFTSPGPHTLTFSPAIMQFWLSDGVLDIELRNSSSVYANPGDNHQVIFKLPRSSWIVLGSQSRTIAANDSSTVMVKLRSEYLLPGNNYGSIQINSTAPGFPYSIPVIHNVSGNAVLDNISTSCISFGTKMQYSTNKDTFLITNSGCDSLFIDSITTTNSDFSVFSSPSHILAYESGQLVVNWQPSGVGTYNDTITIHSNGGSQQICMSGNSLGAPFAQFFPDTIVDTLYSCTDSLIVPIKILNPGSGPLKFYPNTLQSIDTTSNIAYTTSGASTSHTFHLDSNMDTLNMEIVIDGDFDGSTERTDLSIDGNFIQSLGGAGLLQYTYNFQFYGSQLATWLADGTLNVDFQNTAAVNIFTNTSNSHEVRVFGNGRTNWIHTSVDSGTVAAGDSTIINYVIKGLFTNGNYQGNIKINTNTSQGTYVLPVFIHINGAAEAVLSDSCVHFGNVPQGAVNTADVLLVNRGCDTLLVNGISNANTVFSSSYSHSVLDVGDTSIISIDFTPSSISAYTDTVIINTSVGPYYICLSGNGMPSPDISVFPPVLFGQIFSCNDSITVPLKVKNSGNGDLYFHTSDSTLSGNPLINGNYKIAALTGGVSPTEWVNIRNLLSLHYPNALISEITSSNTAVIRDSLVGKHLLIYPEISPGAQLYNINTEIQDFVNAGGGYLEIGTNHNLRFSNIGVFNGTYMGATSSSILNKTSISHPITSNISTNFSASNATAYYSITNPNFLSLVERSGYTTVGALEYGAGRAAIIGFDYYLYSAEAESILVNAISWAVQNGGNKIDWLNGNFPMDTLSHNDSTILDVKFYSDSLYNGLYYSTLYVHSNDPSSPLIAVPCTLQVSGSPEITFASAPACVDFDTIPNGTSKRDSILFFNSGCDTLNLSGVSLQGSQYSATFNTPRVLPGDSAYVYVTFNPNAVGVHNDSLALQFSGGQSKICITGYAHPAPNLIVDPNPIIGTINSCNDSITIPVYLKNIGAGILNVDSVTNRFYNNSLDSVLSNLLQGHSQITSVIPNYYSFTEGVFGNSIGDGGGDMYDGGNRINVRSSSSSSLNNLSYSNNSIIPSTFLGSNGKYFTSKNPGLFVFAADIDNIYEFNISGNLGADGSGISSGTVLSSNSNGIQYSGFVSRVYNSGDPSINHLIIAESNSALAHSFLPTTGLEDHSVTNLNNNNRIYYILFAGSSSRYYSDAEFQVVFDKFMEVINTGTEVDWLDVSNYSGVINPNDSQLVDVKMKSTDLNNGQYISFINVYSNNPSDSIVIVPCTLNVNGIPILNFVQSGCLNFGNQFQYSNTIDSVMVINNGCEDANISNAIAGGAFSIVGYPPVIAVDDTAWIKVEFLPGTLGAHNDSVKLMYQNGGVLSLCLNGFATDPPQISLSPSNYYRSLNVCNDSTTLAVTIHNNGGDTLRWKSFDVGTSRIYDDFENGFANIWDASVSTSVTTSHTCGSINGLGSALFIGAQRSLQTIPLNVINADTVSFSYRNGGFGCTTAEFSEYISLQYSINGGLTWSTIDQTGFASGTQIIEAQMPAAAKTNSTVFRLYQQYHTGTSNDFWLIDDFEIISSNSRLFSNNLSFSVDSGIVSIADSITISVTLKATGLSTGLQTKYIYIYSNDPTKPVDSIPVTINVSGRPCTDFNYNQITSCSGSVQFTDTSEGAPTSWYWTFGDGSFSNQQSPLHTYLTSGLYNVQLVTCNSHGCDTMNTPIQLAQVTSPRVANCASPSTLSHCCGYGITNVILNTINNTSGVGSYEDFSCSHQTTLTAGNSYSLSVSTGNTEDVWAWIDYNNNGVFEVSESILTSYSTSSHSNTFSVPTTAILNQSLRLRIGSQLYGYTALTGCNDTYRGQYEDYTVIIQSMNAPPSANFTFNNVSVCQGVFSFTDNSMNFPTSRMWHFGDGMTSTLSNPFHTYSNPGIYDVKLIVTNSYGVDSIEKQINVVKPKPVIGVSGSLFANQTLNFSVTGAASPSFYNWDFGDGSPTSNLATPSHSYSTNGLFIVTVNIIDANNCSATARDTLNIILTDIKEHEEESMLNIYPNPNNGTFIIDHNENFRDFSVELINYNGATVYNKQYSNHSKNVMLSVEHLAKGVYMLRVSSMDKVSIKKIIIQ